MNQNSQIKFIDLCSGIGGFHLGLKDFKCILACDKNKYCRESYKNNYLMECEEDIFDINVENMNSFDILCAGFPCQPFSSAGLKKGMSDKRSDVYGKISEIINNKHPKIILLENVKNLVSINKGVPFKKIIEGLEENYYVSYSILNTSNFGLAQNRERIFIVCVSKTYYKTAFDFNKLNRIKITKYLKDIIDLTNTDYISTEKYVLLEDDKIKKQKSGLIFCGYIKGNKRKNGVLPNTEHLSRVHRQPNRIYSINGVHPTLSSSERSGRYYIYDGIGVRKLTLDECFKIMGFPIFYKLHTNNGVNYSQIGNAVSPTIVENIKKELVRQNFI